MVTGDKKHMPKLLPMLPQSLGPDMAWISGTPDRSSSLMTQLLVLLVESLLLKMNPAQSGLSAQYHWQLSGESVFMKLKVSP